MDDFETKETISMLEKQVDKLTVIIDNFVNGFDGKIQNQIADLINLLLDKPEKGHIENYEDYIIKLICSLGYGQYCILQNQRKILELLGSKEVNVKELTLKEKRKIVEKILADMEDPYDKIQRKEN